MAESTKEQPTESQELQQSESSSPVSSSQPFWRAPERIIALLAAVGLYAWGKLSEEWLGAVLLTALGAPLTQAAIKIVQKVRGK